MSTMPFPVGAGTAAGYNQSTFDAVAQTQVSLITGHSQNFLYFQNLTVPVDPLQSGTFVDLEAIESIPFGEATIDENCASAYTAINGYAMIGFCANGLTVINGAIIIARCQGEYGGEIVEPPNPPEPPVDRCPPMALCDILPDLSFLQEPNE